MSNQSNNAAEKLACVIRPIIKDIVDASRTDVLKNIKMLEDSVVASKTVQDDILLNLRDIKIHLQDIKTTMNGIKMNSISRGKQLQKLDSNCNYQIQFDAIMRKLSSIDATICRIKLGIPTQDMEQGMPENLRIKSSISDINLFSDSAENIDIDCD